VVALADTDRPWEEELFERLLCPHFARVREGIAVKDLSALEVDVARTLARLPPYEADAEATEMKFRVNFGNVCLKRAIFEQVKERKCLRMVFDFQFKRPKPNG